MRNIWVLIAISALFAAQEARADDVNCDDPKIKTCFMDGESVSCNCFDPPENRDDPVVEGPPANENPSEYEPPEGQ